MSSGQFTIRIYEADSGEKHLLRQQPEGATLEIDGTPNTVQAGPATSPFWAKANRGAREYGLLPRKLRGRWNPGQQPPGYKEGAEFEVVVYSKSVFDGAAIGGSVSYLAGNGLLVGKVKEDIYPPV